MCTRRPLAFGPHVRAVLGDEFQLWGGIDFLDGVQARDVFRMAPEDPNGSPDGKHPGAHHQKVPIHLPTLVWFRRKHKRGQLAWGGLGYRSPTDLSTPVR